MSMTLRRPEPRFARARMLAWLLPGDPRCVWDETRPTRSRVVVQYCMYVIAISSTAVMYVIDVELASAGTPAYRG